MVHVFEATVNENVLLNVSFLSQQHERTARATRVHRSPLW